MQWSGAQKNAGFSNSDKTWLPINPNYVNVNVESEKLDPNSHLNIYKNLIGEWYKSFVRKRALVKSVSYTHLTLPTTPYV